MSTTFTTTTELTTINCGCGGVYAIQERFRQKKQQEGGSWTCPYCQRGWGYANNGENARLKREVEAKQLALDRAEKRRAQALQEADHFRKSRDGMKGALVKTQKRVAGGVCPCCQRSFVELGRHMKTKHPTYGTPICEAA